MSLRSQRTTLALRQTFIKKNGWKKDQAQTTCPEIYLQVMVEHIAKLVTMSLYSELWDDFSFHFAPKIDQHLYYGLSDADKKRIIRNDPKVSRHLELLQKRDKLEAANDQLTELLRNYYAAKARSSSGTKSSSS